MHEPQTIGSSIPEMTYSVLISQVVVALDMHLFPDFDRLTAPFTKKALGSTIPPPPQDLSGNSNLVIPIRASVNRVVGPYPFISLVLLGTDELG